MSQPSPTFSRRRVVFGAGGLAIAAAAVTAGGLAWSSPWTPQRARADEISGGYFDLTVPSEKFIREQNIHHNTVLQSFVFDDETEHIYVLQVIQDNVQLPGESEPISWEQRGKDGDLCVSKIDFSGTVLEYMFCKKFGHGVSCGLEKEGDDVYLWTEVDAGPVEGHPDRYGFGQAITRFKFVHDQVIEFGVDDLEVHYLKPGTTGNMPSVDMLNKRLAIKYSDSDTDTPNWCYAVYDLDEVREGVYEPVHDMEQVGLEPEETFQGFALYGDYIYQMTGTMYTDENGDNPPSERGNCHVSSIDVRTGELVERFHTEAGYTLPFREPEGVAIQQPTGQPPRLFMGFADGVSGGRNISLYYKEQA